MIRIPIPANLDTKKKNHTKNSLRFQQCAGEGEEEGENGGELQVLWLIKEMI